ncbi:MAG: hypothetical protein ACOX28_03215 [Bacilli bacterium]|jgi:hypothetical protein
MKKRTITTRLVPVLLFSLLLTGCGTKTLNSEKTNEKLTTLNELRPLRPESVQVDVSETIDANALLKDSKLGYIGQVTVNSEQEVTSKFINYQLLLDDEEGNDPSFGAETSVNQNRKGHLNTRDLLIFDPIDKDFGTSGISSYYSRNGIHYANEEELVDIETNEKGTKHITEKYYDYRDYLVYAASTERLEYLYDYNLNLFLTEEGKALIMKATQTGNKLVIESKIDIEKLIRDAVDELLEKSLEIEDVEISDYRQEITERENFDIVTLNKKTADIYTIETKVDFTCNAHFKYNERNLNLVINADIASNITFSNLNKVDPALNYPSDLNDYSL